MAPVTIFPLIDAHGYGAFFVALALVGTCGTAVALALPRDRTAACGCSAPPPRSRVLSPKPAGSPRQPAPARVGLQRGRELRPDRRRSARILQRRRLLAFLSTEARRQPRRRMGDRSVRREAPGGLHHRRQRPGAAHGASRSPEDRGGVPVRSGYFGAATPVAPRAHRRAAAPARSWRGSKARSTWE
ncbi:MAG: hypothetical protein ACLTMP_07755 [Eggerthella lenta]